MSAGSIESSELSIGTADPSDIDKVNRKFGNSHSKKIRSGFINFTF